MFVDVVRHESWQLFGIVSSMWHLPLILQLLLSFASRYFEGLPDPVIREIFCEWSVPSLAVRFCHCSLPIGWDAQSYILLSAIWNWERLFSLWDFAEPTKLKDRVRGRRYWDLWGFDFKPKSVLVLFDEEITCRSFNLSLWFMMNELTSFNKIEILHPGLSECSLLLFYLLIGGQPWDGGSITWLERGANHHSFLLWGFMPWSRLVAWCRNAFGRETINRWEGRMAVNWLVLVGTPHECEIWRVTTLIAEECVPTKTSEFPQKSRLAAHSAPLNQLWHHIIGFFGD